PLIIFELAFKGAEVLLGALGTGWIMGPLVASTGHAAVTNTEIARFLVSPAGGAYPILIALSLMLAPLLEHVGLIAIAAAPRRGCRVAAGASASRWPCWRRCRSACSPSACGACWRWCSSAPRSRCWPGWRTWG